MTLGGLLAAICIVVGFAIAIFEGHLLFGPETWFVAAIPLAILGGPVVFPFRKRGGGTA